MGLRQFLQDIQGVNQATQGAYDATNQLRQQLAMQKYAQAIPGILQSGDTAALAGAAAEAQDLPTLRSLVANSTKFQPKAQPISEAYRKNLEQVAGVKLDPSLTADQAKELASVAGQKAALAQKEDFFTKSQARLTGKDVKTRAKDFSAPLLKTEKEINDSTSSLQSQLNAFRQKATPASLNLVIRSLVKASGDTRVSDQDIAGLQIKGLGSSAQEVLNYLNSATAETLNDEQKAEVLRLADSMLKSAEERKNRVLGEQFQSQVNNFPDLLEGGGHPAVLNQAEKLGYERPEIGDDGRITLRKKAKQVSGDSRLGKLLQMANGIQDPTRKRQAIEALNAYTNETLDAGKAQMFEQKIKEFGGK